MAYTVFRSDLMTGTDVCANLASAKVYASSAANADPIAVENGTIIKLLGLDGTATKPEREVFKAVLATADDDASECVIVATPEVQYDERKKNLDEFINEAGTIVRGYIPVSRNIYSVTKEGFTGTLPTAAGTAVGIGANGKLDITGTGWGKVIAIENAGRYTYYVIQLA